MQPVTVEAVARTGRRGTKVLRDRLAVHPKPAELLLNTLQQPAADRIDIIRIVQVDPALAAGVLRHANAVHIGFARQISSIRQATVLVGHDVVEAISASRVADQHFTKHPVVYPSWLWTHSVTIATCCAVLAKRVGIAPDEAYTVGLLHDVGWLLAASNHEELAKFDRTHTQLGAQLLTRWNLPERITSAVNAHHTLVDASVGPMAKLLMVAHSLAAELGDTIPEHRMPLNEALNLLNIAPKPTPLIAETEAELAHNISALDDLL